MNWLIAWEKMVERLDCLGYRFFRNILLLLIILKNLKFFFEISRHAPEIGAAADLAETEN